MRLIIAGGRNYELTPDDHRRLHAIARDHIITEVVTGGAKGADECGQMWAASLMLPIKVFRADWRQHGRAAGPIRNREMAAYADAVALFPGGKGTDDMARAARAQGIRIFDYRKTEGGR